MSQFVGVAGRRGRFLVIEPLFERGSQLSLGRGSIRVADGEMVLAEPAGRSARVIDKLGSPGVAREVVDALLLDRGFRRGFDETLAAEARQAAAEARESGLKRRDLRELTTFTVDPVTARDFDDAVSAAPEGDGIRLWIHIADVAAHVRPGSVLDAEARRRASSTYVPGTVEPMLPLELSADVCSLVPGEDRLAVTAEVVLDAAAETVSASFYRSHIRSDVRLSYEQLDLYFAGRQPAPPEIAGPLELARRAAAGLRERRAGSALEVSTAEPEFEFDREGHVVAAHSVEQTEAHGLIEQLMILTNERVAELCEQRGVSTLYRVHERPDPQRVAILVAKLDALGVPTPPLPDPETMSSTQAGELVAEASTLVAREAERRGHGRAAYTSLVLRSLKPAVYSDRNLGHAGLGSPAYSHFTSPIRRYPDLIAHRALLSVLQAGEDAPDRTEVREAGPWCSERERESMMIERDADDVCSAFLLERELLGKGWKARFEGEVSGVIGAGAFISFGGELGDVYEGMLPVRRMRGDHYDLNPTETALVGRRSRREIRLGDPIEVRVGGIENARGRVDLVLAEEPRR